MERFQLGKRREISNKENEGVGQTTAGLSDKVSNICNIIDTYFLYLYFIYHILYIYLQLYIISRIYKF